MLLARVLEILNQQKLITDQTRNSGKALLGLQHEGVKTSNRCPCSLPDEGQAGLLNGVRVGADWYVRLEGWLR